MYEKILDPKMLTKHKFSDDIEALLIEINFRKCRWLLCALYDPPSQSDQSDCYKLVIFVFKTTFSKTGPEKIMYRVYKNFDQEIFSQELCTNLSSQTVHGYTSFEENFLGVLNKHAPLKKKILCTNHAPYVTKALK